LNFIFLKNFKELTETKTELNHKNLKMSILGLLQDLDHPSKTKSPLG